MEKYLAQASKYNYLILFGLAAFSLLGMGIILWNYAATEHSIKYFNTPNFPIWLMLITIFTGILPVFGIPLWSSLHSFRHYIKKHLKDIVLSSIFLYGLFMASIPFAIYIIQLDFPLYGHVVKMAIIFTLGYFAVLPAAIGLWSIIDASRLA